MEKVFFLKKDCMYEYFDGRVVKKPLKKEKGIYTSIIYFKDIFNHTFKLPANIPEDELFIKIEDEIFKESTLNLDKEYKIVYKIHKFEDYYLIDAFIVEVDKLKELFKDLVENFKYIDFISAAPFVFEEYYNLTKLEPKIDIFIYFTPTDSFLAGYKDKELLFVKGLDKFSKLSAQTSLAQDTLIKILEEKGLNKDLYEDKDLYTKIENFFSQFFMRVNNILSYTRNFYNIDRIDRIFFYSNIKIKNLFETYKQFWYLSKIEFKKFELKTEYDPFDYCTTFFNAKNYSNEEINFSIFLRPPKFYKTELGKIVIFSAFLLFLITADAFYKYKIIKVQEREIFYLQSVYNKKLQKLKRIKSLIKEYKKKIKKVRLEISAIDTEINDLALKVDFLYKLKVNNLLYNQIAKIINFATLNNLEILSLKKDGKNFVVLLQSKTDNSKLIPKFINYLISLGYKDVFSKEIINSNNVYITQIRFNSG